jgi:hypothetical protein
LATGLYVDPDTKTAEEYGEADNDNNKQKQQDGMPWIKDHTPDSPVAIGKQKGVRRLLHLSTSFRAYQIRRHQNQFFKGYISTSIGILI